MISLRALDEDIAFARVRETLTEKLYENSKKIFTENGAEGQPCRKNLFN
jgi:hypothetical protein